MSTTIFTWKQDSRRFDIQLVDQHNNCVADILDVPINEKVAYEWHAWGTDGITNASGAEITELKAANEVSLWLSRRHPDFQNAWISQNRENTAFKIQWDSENSGAVFLVKDKWQYNTFVDDQPLGGERNSLEEAMKAVENNIKLFEEFHDFSTDERFKPVFDLLQRKVVLWESNQE